MDSVRAVATVLVKELLDALRDRRTLVTVLLSSVLLGPLVLVAVSSLVAALEVTAERREVYVAGADRSPTLINFFERQTYTVKAAPPDYEAALRSARLADPVVVVPADVEAALMRGEGPVIEVVSDSSNQRSQSSARRIERLLEGFSRERSTISLALRGVSNELLAPIHIETRDLANPQSRATQFTGMLPFFVMMAVLYGALNAALDTTAGERERGSLEPLLMNPAERWALVVGKWGAVSGISMLIAVLSSLSFMPAQWLLRSDTLAALFRYGPREASLFLVVLLPFAAALSAVLMAAAIRCRTFKEAQASAAVVVLVVSLLPLVTVLNPGAEAPWQLWIPALAQNALMTRVLKGEAMDPAAVLIPLGVCTALTIVGVWYVARTLRSAALR
jgi:sodium transport system permease protein